MLHAGASILPPWVLASGPKPCEGNKIVIVLLALICKVKAEIFHSKGQTMTLSVSKSK